MRSRWLLVLMAPLVAVGCGAGDEASDRPPEVDSAIAQYQAEEAPVESAPLVLQGDTLQSALNYRCSDGTPVHAAYWAGPGARVVLATADTNMVLPQVEAASGARYEVAQAKMTWWIRGDSAQFTRRGSDLSCGRDDTVEF